MQIARAGAHADRPATAEQNLLHGFIQPDLYAELPGAQHAFDVFHSIRSAYAVRAVDRYLTWHWNTWRHGLEADSGAEPEEIGALHQSERDAG